MHEERSMAVTLDLSFEEKVIFDLQINGINFNDLPEAPARQRERLARSNTSINMHGHKKQGLFPLLREGELITVSVQLNKQTKFAKLQVGKQIVTAKQRQG